MTASVSDIYLLVEERVKQIQDENDIANDIIGKYALHHPEVAKMLLKEYQARQIFKTNVGLNFLASLERVIKNDKRDSRYNILCAFFMVLSIALAWALVTLPKLLFFL